MIDAEILRGRLAHVVVTTATPFDSGGALDLDAAAAQARFLADAGIKVVVPCGNTGEFSSLSLDEAKAVVGRVVDEVADRCTVVAGVGWSAPMAVELTRHAADAGAHAVMVHHPAHTYIHPDGLRRYYDKILDAADIGVVLYKRGPQLADALIAELALHEQVVAVKYAVNDLNAFTELVASCPAPVTWLCGTAERWAPFFALAGAQGFTSGLANVAPDRALTMFELLAAGDLFGAMKVRAEVAEFEELRQRHDSGDNVPVVKEALRLLGRDSGLVRDPLVEPDAEASERIRQILGRWGITGVTE
jgi:4-hydroxy-tetrahydrodipicolinate synthase